MNVRIQLPKKWIQYLSEQPESGMGYQLVDIFFVDGTYVNDCIVFNAEQIDLPKTYAKKKIQRITFRKTK
jgi:hypothetical protein